MLDTSNGRRLRPDKPFGWTFVAPLLWGAAMNPINSSIIATALLAIGHAFDASAGQTALLVASVYLASAVAQPTMGKLSTRFGARRIFVIGMGIVVVAGIIGTVAPTFVWLVVSRALIGLGTSAGYPTAMALIRERAEQFKAGIPGGVLGSIAIAGQITVALGLPLGGLLVGAYGWRAIFFINVPIGVLGIIFTLLWVPADRPVARVAGESLVTALDVLGIVLFAGAIFALLGFLSNLRNPIWWLVPVVIVVAAALIWWEHRAQRPFIDVRMLRQNHPLVRTYIRNCAMMIATYCVLYGMSQWMEESRGLSPATVGLVLLPMTAVGAVASAIVSRRNQVRGPLVWSGVSVVVGAAVLGFVDSSVSILVLVVLSVIFGLTGGLSSIGNQAALYNQSDVKDIAVASGLLRTSNYIGAIFSSSLIGLAFGQTATDSGLRIISYVFGGLGILILLMATLDRAIPRRAR
ncbi:MFS transporter [Arthrobacter sp. NPDC058127]|uniref:MFS transporter n=1 Tax=Arthrobacter sp. NPDC058127 TaxID=3346351 RepID=UPI0036E456F5